jgi:hypothetical protein
MSIDFKKVKLSLAEAKEQITSEKNSTDNFFSVGQYTVEIVKGEKSSYQPVDPTWVRNNYELKGTNDKKAFLSIDYPTQSTAFMNNGKNVPIVFINFIKNAEALGMKETDDLSVFIEKNLLNPESLVGVKLKITMGYDNYRAHTKFISAGVLEGELKGKPLVDSSGNTLRFNSREGVEAYCISQGMKFQSFVSPQEIIEAEFPTKITVTKKAAKPVVEEEVDDLPF